MSFLFEKVTISPVACRACVFLLLLLFFVWLLMMVRVAVAVVVVVLALVAASRAYYMPDIDVPLHKWGDEEASVCVCV